jgi:glycosyltransferase involved in cell wall biosynthesis
MNNKSIHILQISNASVCGGLRKHIHDILKNLDKKTFKQSYAHSLTFDTIFSDEIEDIEQDIYKIIPLNIKRNPSVTDIGNIWKLIKYVKKERVNIVHGHGAKGGLYARLLAATCGVKAIYTPHGGVVHSMFNPIVARLYLFIEKSLLRYTDYLLFESQYSANQFKNKIGNFKCGSQVNYNGVSLPDLESIERESSIKSSHSGLKLGIFAILRKEKGHIYAIQAVAELKQLGKIVHLHIFGDGADREKLRASVIELGLKEEVIFHGEVSQVEQHIYAMDIILIPSLFESFGYIAIEAMSLNKWVIASKVGGLPEIIEDGVNGSLIPAGSSVEIAKVIFFLEDQILNKKLISKGLDTEKFGLNKMIINIMKVYSGLLTGNIYDPSEHMG